MMWKRVSGLAWIVLVSLIVGGFFVPQATPVHAATTHCVNPQGNDGCFASIQAAIDASSAGDIVEVAAGTYVEDITLKAGVSLSGAGTGLSIIQGSGAAAGSNWPVVRAVDGRIGQDTVVEGFTITNGNRNVTVMSFGGGVFMHYGASPTIRNNLITGNRATLGGGMAVFGGGHPAIENNVITGNTSSDAGGIYVNNSSPTISGNQVTDNHATEQQAANYGHGGGMVVINGAAPTIIDNTISSNVSGCDGGGLVVQDNAGPNIIGNTIEDNHAMGSTPCGIGGGIKYYANSSGILEENLIRGNTASNDGGGVYLEYSAPEVLRNRFLTNQATGYGGGLVLNNSNARIANNYIVDNRAGLRGGGIFVLNLAPVLVNNTIVGNGIAGVGEGVCIWPEQAAPSLYNNVIVGNSYGIWRTPGTFTGAADYNLVWNNSIANYTGLEPGAHDVAAAPLFSDPIEGDFSLLPGSPAIDTGTKARAPDVDIEGVPRPQDGDLDGTPAVDLGAHEQVMGAALTVSPSEITFLYDPAQGDRQPTGTLTIRNSGGTVGLSYTISLPSNRAFDIEFANPLSGWLAPNSSVNIGYQLDIPQLRDGTYTVALTVVGSGDGGASVAGSPATVQITVVLGTIHKDYLPLVVR